MTTFRLSPEHRPDPANPNLIPYRDTWGPVRIQRKRTKGWRMPEGAVYVGRPSRWGNPFVHVVAHPPRAERAGTTPETLASRDGTVAEFRQWARIKQYRDPSWLEPLRGHDLACWCPLDQPCHADVLLELANR